MRKLTKNELEYLSAVKNQIQSLQSIQDELYKLALNTLELEDTDESFDFMFNGGELEN